MRRCYYYNARWYDPNLGRFITEDPARSGYDWYVYCENNPLRFVDPSGLLGQYFEMHSFGYSDKYFSFSTSPAYEDRFYNAAELVPGIVPLHDFANMIAGIHKLEFSEEDFVKYCKDESALLKNGALPNTLQNISPILKEFGITSNIIKFAPGIAKVGKVFGAAGTLLSVGAIAYNGYKNESERGPIDEYIANRFNIEITSQTEDGLKTKYAYLYTELSKLKSSGDLKETKNKDGYTQLDLNEKLSAQLSNNLLNISRGLGESKEFREKILHEDLIRKVNDYDLKDAK